MASPVAHTLAGTIIYLATRPGNRGGVSTLLWLILAANLADFDLIPSLLMGDDNLFHRTFSHSISASFIFALIVLAACVLRRHPDPVRMTLLMFCAYLSQLLVDWLSLDPPPVSGIPLFWPWSHEHYMANPTVFLNIERHNLFTTPVIIHNIMAVARELAIMGPPAALLWWRSRTTGQR